MKVTCPPDTDFLDALRNDNLTWRDVVGELVDNSLDAGATRVTLELGPGRRVVVSDDGAGIERIEQLVTVGRHVRRSTTRLGRYGIGFKSSACWMWGKTLIKTVCGGNSWECPINWDVLRKSGLWDYETTDTAKTSEPCGTVISFTDIEKRMPAVDAIMSDLSFTFAPAIRDGRQLCVIHNGKRKTCTAYELPPIDDIVEDSFTVNGKPVRLRAGIVKAGQKNSKPGFIYQHGHRVIMVSSLGAMEYSVSHVTGVVVLGDSWALTKNKNEISDTDRDEMALQVFTRCRAILEKAQTKTQAIELKNLTTRLQDTLRGMFAQQIGRERRPGESRTTGTVDPTNSGKRRHVVTAIGPGERKLIARAASSLIIDWYEEDDCGLMGKADFDTNKPRVSFNLAHPFIKRAKENQDAMTLAAINLFMTAVFENNQKDMFPCLRNYDDALQACSGTLAGIVNGNGQTK
jgi:hypothetical protein